MADTTAVWRGDMSFEIELHGHKFIVDADESVGGSDQGPRPKALMLSSLAGCTGMDVVSILNKMQMPFDRFELKIDGTTADSHPKVYNKVTVVYQFWGDKLDESKIEKAVTLSQDKYCGVSETLKQLAEVDYAIELNPAG
ncbi:MAG: OsmC family protein [Alkalispirochaeta sp.]|jgi:putative redox protein